MTPKKIASDLRDNGSRVDKLFDQVISTQENNTQITAEMFIELIRVTSNLNDLLHEYVDQHSDKK